jgi:hypothetical protein
MPTRRRRSEASSRRWVIWLLFALGVVGGVLLWAWRPDLPRDVLIQHYTNAHSKFVDVGGVRAPVRDEGPPHGKPRVMIHRALG